ncbi:cache domain-containing sensor histidine kinase [Paenibacillus sp. JDR-2]|uniref:cache domain-containing sensor histidine kinase n=1 Tax=Paenibacillus sp. (strain JDR-2) TaxID=324057 RepID=UPI0001668F52|nr:sensor histidine kinase [Paenibacillus sp. JDR-2]ACS99573.1 histidine kinase [Paenibacillus sp. JDR-2]
MLRAYFNLSLKFKIIIPFALLMTVFSALLGYYAIQTSKTQIVNKVSSTNLGVVRVVENNMQSMQKAISNWVTVFVMDPYIQSTLQMEVRPQEGTLDPTLYNGSTTTLMNQMLLTGNFDYVALYGKEGPPLFQVATDDSSGSGTIQEIQANRVYKETAVLRGAPLWFPLTSDNVFIQNNRKDKIGMTRIVRNINNGYTIGFIFVGVNQETIKAQYLANLYDKDHGIVILDSTGEPLLEAGKPFFKDGQSELDAIRKAIPESGSKVVKLDGESLLLTYSKGENGWQYLYAVPLSTLTKELNSIKQFVMLLIAVWLVMSIPVMLLLTMFLTAPIKNLLLSMRRFQNGQFDEKVDVKYGDEIGYLTQGYNSMVESIKALVDDAYVLRLREQEAELKALQAQINPHFLYNMLDTIFWEAESAGQEKISEMIINLSRLFRLSLNRGKSFTNVAKERELLELYLSLQKMRFRDVLEYEVDISPDLGEYVILKLLLQPFVENAIVHGIERKRGGGFVRVTGTREGDRLKFVIEDNGSGMGEEELAKLTELPKESDINVGQDTSGYAVRNVQERLKHYYKDDFELTYDSKPGQGTRVQLIIPAVLSMGGSDDHVSTAYRG